MRFRLGFSQQSGPRKRQCDERSESSDDCVHGCVLDLIAFGGRNEPPRQTNRSRGKPPPSQKNRLPQQNDGSSPALLLDSYSVCYWTNTTFVIGGCSVYCAVGFTECVIFATLQNLFLTATVQDDFSVWMSRIYYKWGHLHEVSSHQAFSCRRWSQDERQPRGCILERAEGDRRRARHDVVGADRRDR